MIKIENVKVTGFEEALRGIRNSWNSWSRSDSYSTYIEDPETLNIAEFNYILGDNDLELMRSLSSNGGSHAKFRRMIVVWADVTAPLYWWKEYDTYKVGTVANACSTMHTIANKEFEAEDFSCEHLKNEWDSDVGCSPLEFLDVICYALNKYRKLYLESGDKMWWWQIIQTLPSSYNQKRTVMLNYEVLANIRGQRRNHKLDEWQQFCDWIETLPYSDRIIFESEGNRIENLYADDCGAAKNEGADSKEPQQLEEKDS